MKITEAIHNPKVWAAAMILAGTILRLWYLDIPPLWYDEAFTAALAGLPFARMIAATAGDVHPPLYYMVVWLAVHVGGGSVFVLRLPSVIFAVLGLVMFLRFTSHMNMPSMARLAALALLTFHPVAIYYAQEARMYSLFMWLVLAQTTQMLKRNWIGLAWYTLAALYTHNYAVFYTLLITLIGLARELKRPVPTYRAGIDHWPPTGMRALGASVIMPGLLWLPWLGVLLGQMRAIRGSYWIPPITVGSVAEALLHILAGYNVPAQLTPITVLCGAAGLALALIFGRKRLMLVILAFGPLLCAIAASLAWRPVLLDRGLIGMLPPLAVLAGSAMVVTNSRGRVVLVMLLFPLLVTTVWQLGAANVGMSKVSRIRYVQPTGQPVVHLTDFTLVLSGRTDGYLLDAGCPMEPGALSPVTRQAIGYRTINLSDLPNEYYLEAGLGPMSTKCHENVYQQLIGSSETIYRIVGDLGEYGVIHHALR